LFTIECIGVNYVPLRSARCDAPALNAAPKKGQQALQLSGRRPSELCPIKISFIQCCSRSTELQLPAMDPAVLAGFTAACAGLHVSGWAPQQTMQLHYTRSPAAESSAEPLSCRRRCRRCLPPPPPTTPHALCMHDTCFCLLCRTRRLVHRRRRPCWSFGALPAWKLAWGCCSSRAMRRCSSRQASAIMPPMLGYGGDVVGWATMRVTVSEFPGCWICCEAGR